ncbi:MAG: helix-turn-helix transcriptional regulator [Gammaproteobacteria bacterium]|nr:helix-turn-helix transcriptional regulator [Gammaproteobacteria bacterium]
MIRDIKKCSYASLNAIFSPLNQFEDCIFWIRNKEMTQQIYINHTYEAITNRKIELCFEVPLMFFDYLTPEYKIAGLKQFQARHDLGYINPSESIACYQWDNPDGTSRYFRCQCFRTEDFTKEQYIVGVAKSLSAEDWFHPNSQTNIDEKHQKTINVAFDILKANFGIKVPTLRPILSSLLSDIRNTLLNIEKTIFSAREIESLYFLCQGKTAKQTAQIMGISPRTVETYIETLRAKTGCINKMALISKFSRYFQDFN